jgi:hypothetical protein
MCLGGGSSRQPTPPAAPVSVRAAQPPKQQTPTGGQPRPGQVDKRRKNILRTQGTAADGAPILNATPSGPLLG